MGRTRGMFLRLINGKVEMLRAVYKGIICLLYVIF